MMDRTLLSLLRRLAAPLLAALAFCVPAVCAVPGFVTFQGRLLDSNKLPRNGLFSISFKLCDTLAGACDGTCQAGSSCLWREDKTVAVSNGIFSVRLGSSTPITGEMLSGSAVYLDITVDGETLSPREAMSGGLYSIKAVSAEGLVNNDGSSLLNISSVAAGSIYTGALADLSVTDGKLAGSISPSKISGTAAVLGSNVFTGDQSIVDGAKLDLSGVTPSGPSEGLLLPQGSDVSAGTGEGQLQWDSDDDLLQVGTGAGVKTIGIPNSIQVYSSAGSYTWTRPAGVSTVYVQVWGAGGGGGTAASNNSRGGGGSGGYSAGLVSVSANASVTVGSGGSAGSSGGSSSFAGDSTLTASGGGASTSVTGGTGGSASGGTINLAGQAGGAGLAADGGRSGDGGNAPFGGGGGKGKGGGNASGTTGLSGDSGQQPGGGGGGGAESSGTGGSGAAGMVIVMY